MLKCQLPMCHYMISNLVHSSQHMKGSCCWSDCTAVSCRVELAVSSPVLRSTADCTAPCQAIKPGMAVSRAACCAAASLEPVSIESQNAHSRLLRSQCGARVSTPQLQPTTYHCHAAAGRRAAPGYWDLEQQAHSQRLLVNAAIPCNHRKARCSR